MAKPPVLKAREVAALLGKLGFNEVRQRGSHRQFRHSDSRRTTVPFHQGRDISPTLLAVTIEDPDHSAGEARFLTTGLSSQQRIIIVAHTDRGDRIRLISAREVTAAERRTYEEGDEERR